RDVRSREDRGQDRRAGIVHGGLVARRGLPDAPRDELRRVLRAQAGPAQGAGEEEREGGGETEVSARVLLLVLALGVCGACRSSDAAGPATSDPNGANATSAAV